MTAEKFSNQQLAGQRLMVGFDGTDFNADLRFIIDQDLKVGGLILFAGNLAAPDQITDLCQCGAGLCQNAWSPAIIYCH